MTPKKKPSTLTFDDFYFAQYGARWERLKNALIAGHPSIHRPNAFAGEGLNPVYVMDQASCYAVDALDVQPGQSVLDLCAAPGGKSLIIAERLWASTTDTVESNGSSLTVNELSATRRGRLKSVLKEYLPQAVLEKIKVTGFDAGKWCQHETNAYDRILLDAPCSSEEHVLTQPKHLKEWTPNRSPQLAQRQYALLCSALRVLKPGGTLVYSTCSISHLENDQVVERAIKSLSKKEIRIQKIDFNVELGNKTTFGQIILPDQDSCGPLYISVLTKISSS